MHDRKQSIGAKTIVFPTPVFIVGSYGADGRPNLMTVAWGGICSSDPPSIAISVRSGRLSHANILHSKAFTINIPNVDQVRQADFVGIYSGRDMDKFKETGLTPVRGDSVNAPCVLEFPLCIECRLLHDFDLGAHTQFVGEIIDVLADKSVLDDKGGVDIAKVRPITFSPADGGYYGIGSLIGSAFAIGKKPE